MIEKDNKSIIIDERWVMLDVSRQDIETYLFEVKKAIKEGNYRIARN